MAAPAAGYTPQSNIAQWLLQNERFATPRNPQLLLQSIRDGTFIWKILTIHLPEPPEASATITERWKQIALALLEVGVELTPLGLKLILLGDADTIDKLLSVLFSLHHPGGQGTAAVAYLITPFVPEPELLYPKLFHSTLVNAKQNNFVERVRVLTEGCCNANTAPEEKEFLQLEALSSHSKRLVEYGLAEKFFRMSIRAIWRQQNSTSSLKVAGLLKAFVQDIGPDSSFAALVGKANKAELSSSPLTKSGSSSRRSLVSVEAQEEDKDAEYRTPEGSFRMLSEILRNGDAQPELQDFIRMLLANMTAVATSESATTNAATSGPWDDIGRLAYVLNQLFVPESLGHKATMQQYWHFITRIPDRSMIRPIAPWLLQQCVAMLEGRDPRHESYVRFNANGRFEEGFQEDQIGEGVFVSSSSPAAKKATSDNEGESDVDAPKKPSNDDDDEEGQGNANTQARRTAELRLQLQRRQAHERREREVCAVALRLCLRMISEFPECTSNSDLTQDIIEFTRSPRGVEMCLRPDMLAEVACAMFTHSSFFSHALLCLDRVKNIPELRRMMIQNIIESVMRSYVSDLKPFTAADNGELLNSPSSASLMPGTSSNTSRGNQIVELVNAVCEMMPSLISIGELEGELLHTCAKVIVQELPITGPAAASPPPTINNLSMSNTSLLSARSAASGPTVDGVTMRTVSQLFDLFVTLFDQEPYFQRPVVVSWVTLASYFVPLPNSDPTRVEYFSICSNVMNELLTLSERHASTELILQAMAQVFIEHTTAEGRRILAENVHIFFQTVVRRDVSQMSPADQTSNDAFVKKMKKLCELMSMPTTRVKVKVLDEEEQARLAAQRRQEEEEKKRQAQEEAERARREAHERAEALAAEQGREAPKKYVRKPLYEAPVPRHGEYGRGSIFEFKRTAHWVRNTIILDVIVDKVTVQLMHNDYMRAMELRAQHMAAQNGSIPRENVPSFPESLWSNWNQGKKYAQQIQEKRSEEQAELERREILRRMRDAEVKEKLRVMKGFDKKTAVLHQQQQASVAEEETDARAVIHNTYLKLLVQLYHLFRDEGKYHVEMRESVQRKQREDRRKQEEDERNKLKEKVAKYWEEKEYLESQLQRHREAEEQERERQEREKRQKHLEEQKRKLMTWRLQHQYDAQGSTPGGPESTNTSISEAQPSGQSPPRQPPPKEGGIAKKKQPITESKASPAAAAAKAANAAGAGGKLAPIKRSLPEKVVQALVPPLLDALEGAEAPAVEEAEQ